MTHSKKYIILIILFAINLNVLPQESLCPPTHGDIYSFNPETIFQYKYTETSFCCDPPFETVKIEKYSIKDKWISGDSIFYTREGLKYEYSTEPPFGDIVSRKSSLINDTILEVDSVNHFLNACQGDTVKIDLENFYSKIVVDSTDGLLIKSVGGWDNIFDYNQDDSLVTAIGYEYEQIFGNGLGLINEYTMIFEYVSSIDLEGYIIDGDTTGTISPDSDFVNSLQELGQNNTISIYPTLIKDNNVITIEGIEGPFDIRVISLGGKEQSFDKLDDNRIILENPAPGIFLIVIHNQNIRSVKKVIIY